MRRILQGRGNNFQHLKSGSQTGFFDSNPRPPPGTLDQKPPEKLHEIQQKSQEIQPVHSLSSKLFERVDQWSKKQTKNKNPYPFVSALQSRSLLRLKGSGYSALTNALEKEEQKAMFFKNMMNEKDKNMLNDAFGKEFTNEIIQIKLKDDIFKIYHELLHLAHWKTLPKPQRASLTNYFEMLVEQGKVSDVELQIEGTYEERWGASVIKEMIELQILTDEMMERFHELYAPLLVKTGRKSTGLKEDSKDASEPPRNMQTFPSGLTSQRGEDEREKLSFIKEMTASYSKYAEIKLNLLADMLDRYASIGGKFDPLEEPSVKFVSQIWKSGLSTFHSERRETVAYEESAARFANLNSRESAKNQSTLPPNPSQKELDVYWSTLEEENKHKLLQKLGRQPTEKGPVIDVIGMKNLRSKTNLDFVWSRLPQEAQKQLLLWSQRPRDLLWIPKEA